MKIVLTFQWKQGKKKCAEPKKFTIVNSFKDIVEMRNFYNKTYYAFYGLCPIKVLYIY